MNKKLYRNKQNGLLGGVSAGLSDYFDIDIIIVRLIFIFLSIFGGGGLLIYIIMWIVVPERKCFEETTSAYQKYDYNESDNNNDMGNFYEGTQTDDISYKKTSIKRGINMDKKFENRQIIGIVLMIIGFFFIIDKYIPIRFEEYLFPVIMIVIGGLLVWNK